VTQYRNMTLEIVEMYLVLFFNCVVIIKATIWVKIAIFSKQCVNLLRFFLPFF